MGSNKLTAIQFYDVSNISAGGCNFHLADPPRYKLHTCTEWVNFPTALPSAAENVWKITLTRTSGIRLVIHCNDVEVLDLLINESTCTNYKWKKYWVKEVAGIKFRSDDSASDFYSSSPQPSFHPGKC